MLRALMDRQHARTDGQCKKRDGNSKNQKEMLEVKNTATEMKRLDMAKERIS